MPIKSLSESSIKEFPHFILFDKSDNFLPFCAVRNHNESFAISTLSSLISTPKILFSRIALSVSNNLILSPVNSVSKSSVCLCSASKKSRV